MLQPQELSDVLHGMGADADDIANSLRTAGVHGVRNTARFLNPIVRFCQSRLSEKCKLDVMQRGILRIALPEQAREVALPSAVIAFLDAFDRGAYPDLELP
jgi:hypothetical protein